MATRVKYNLAVACGSYMKDGQEKPRWVNIGRMLEKEDGGQFLILDRHFNPAGVPNPDDRDAIIVSMFDADDQRQGNPAQSQHQKQKANGYQDDSIPF